MTLAERDRQALDFGRTFWRSAPAAVAALPSLDGGSIDDATFRMLADNIPTLCWVANGDDYIVWYNRRWHDYCGTGPKEMEGWGWTSVHDPEQLPRVMDRWTASIASGEPFEMTFPLRGADGVFRPFLTRVHPVCGSEGKVGRWFGVNTEIFDQVAAEEALRAERDRSRGVLDSMTESFVLLGRDFRVLDINAEAMKLETRPREAIVGRSHWAVWPETEHSALGKMYQRAMAERSPMSLEHRYVWPDGRHAWLEVRAYPTMDGLALFYRDVTERKASEAALVEREQRLRLVIDASTDHAIFSTDLQRRVTSWSRGAVAIFGYPAEEAIGQAADVIFTPEDMAADRPVVEVAIVREEGFADDKRWHLRKDGGRVFLNGSVHPLPLDAQGREQGFIKIARDETSQRRAADAVLESEARFRNMADQAPVMLWVTDPSGSCVYVNRRWYEFTGQEDGAGEGAGWLKVMHPDDRGTAEQAFRSAHAEQRDYRVEFRVRRSDGTFRWTINAAAVRFAAGGEYLGYVGSVIDIDERRDAELALESSTARAEALAAEQTAILGQLAEGVIVADRSGRIVFVNEAATRLHGVARLDVEPDAYSATYNLLTVDGHPYPSDSLPLARAVLASETVVDARWRIRRPNGSEVLAIGSARPITLADGSQAGAVLTVRDDTARAQAEAALRELNDSLEAQVAERTKERDRAWRLSRDVLAVVEQDGTMAAVNAAWTALLGWEPHEIVGQPFARFTHPDDLEATLASFAAMFEAPPATPYENRLRHKDGRYRWLAWTAAFERGRVYASGRHTTAEHEQAEALMRMQEALRQSQKMEAVGQLTGGIAHDFNNMLAVVIGSLDLLGRRIAVADARAKRYIDAAADGARRAALLTQRLLAFSRQQPLQPEPIDVSKLVTGISNLIRGAVGSDIRFETVLASGGWRAHADPNQLENVLLNLAVNARDAMPEGGRLTIETQNAHLDARYAAAHIGVPSGQYVLVAVTDTGSGMTPDVIAKAFDPFFTTKEVGKGTGLGLSQVYGFVKQSGGHVKIYSELDHGTTVKVYLPRLIGMEAAARDDPMVDVLPLGEIQEVILVVEDEPAVRQLSVDALTELGYRVLEADGAETALRLLDGHPETALMFTDVIMPEVNGRKLADEALRRRPGLKVLFTTGYTRNAVVHNGVLDAGVELIGKPFTLEELAAKVRDVLDASAGGAPL